MHISTEICPEFEGLCYLYEPSFTSFVLLMTTETIAKPVLVSNQSKQDNGGLDRKDKE